MVSLSTSDQGQADLLRRLLAALGQLPVRALVTVGPAVDPTQFDPPDNTILELFVPHSAVLPHAALVITHAGHGTVIAALRAGVPLVCIPMGRDQYDVAARVRHHGVGVALPVDAEVCALADGIQRVLAEPEFAEAARRMAAAITSEDPDQVVDAIVPAADQGSAPPIAASRSLQRTSGTAPAESFRALMRRGRNGHDPARTSERRGGARLGEADTLSRFSAPFRNLPSAVSEGLAGLNAPCPPAPRDVS